MSRKILLIFRRTQANRFTLPVLLHALEASGIASQFEIHFADRFSFLLRFQQKGEKFLAVYSFMTPHLPQVIQEVQILRKNPKACLIAGGPHPTGDPQGTLKMGFDVIFVGEGEDTFPGFCKEYMENPDGNWKGRILKPDRAFPLDESFPFSRIDPFMPPLEMMRGCFYHCRFCETGIKKPRFRSLDSAETFINEMLRRNYRFRIGFICPSGFEYGASGAGKPNPERIEALLAMARSKGIRYVEYGIFPSEVRPNTVTSLLLRIVKKYCSNKKITIGAQTGSPPLLQRIGRGHSMEDIESAVANITAHGFTCQIDFILGFPEETLEDQMATVELIQKFHRKYRSRSHVHYFLPLAGTPWYLEKPTPIYPQVKEKLKQLTHAGACTNWWEKGIEQSEKTVALLQTLYELAGSIPQRLS